ncbi:MAG: hypothetical protein NTZ18_04475 [Candidatus Komeilibacteria bacterium]|nr:hypothetical protein [Candidatus Komeilibacteria bacterium]
MSFLKQKISPVLAIVFVAVFGYFSLSFMNRVFEKYAVDEMQSQISQLKAELAKTQVK